MKSDSLMLKYIFVFLLSFIIAQSHAQVFKGKKGSAFSKDEEAQKIFQEGEFWFDGGNYAKALEWYKKILIKYMDEDVLNLKAGICYLYQPDGYEKSLELLGKVDKSIFKKSELSFFYGKALHLNLKFDEAIAEFKTFLDKKGGTKQEREDAEKLLKNCEYAKELMKNPVDVTIDNIGAPINTANFEYVPLITSDESTMLITYRGEKSVGGLQPMADESGIEIPQYAEDILISHRDSLGKWTEPELLHEQINTEGNDACVAFANDGSSFYMFRSIDNDLGTIYESHLEGQDWSEPKRLEGDINTKYWEGSFTISSDGQTAYFASERPGGKGKRDLYQATKLPDGTWGKVKNLEELNTPYDDDAAFIHSSGLYLIFSSRGHMNMGGYDIFRASLVNDSVWANPVNLGYPINTPGDDKFYVVSADGKHGYYSSGKSGGLGTFDIYMSNPGLPGVKIVMAQVKGVITLNDKPVKSNVQVTYTNTGKLQGDYANKEKSGDYLIDFPVGREYTITYKLDGFQSQLRTLSTKDINDFYEVTYDIAFYSDAYLDQLKRKQDSLKALVAIVTPPVVKKDTSQTSTFAIIRDYGNLSKDGLDFRVQIGAYNFPQNFVYTAVKKIGGVERIKLDDNITRFVMGKFKTYNEAAAYRDRIIKAGITDAFVSGIYQNKRYLLVELVSMGILVK
ncbi:MAG: hypothetical protein ACHQF2_04060 [Flavobacteriales bacterium]